MRTRLVWLRGNVATCCFLLPTSRSCPMPQPSVKMRCFPSPSSLLPKRRGRPLRSAPEPCMRLVTSHGSSILRFIVIDTLRCVFRVPLVVTMAVKRKLVAEFFTTTFTFRGDMVNLDLISILEEKFTPPAFSFLFFYQFFQCGLF